MRDSKWEKPKAEEEQWSARVRREIEKTESEGEGTAKQEGTSEPNVKVENEIKSIS